MFGKKKFKVTSSKADPAGKKAVRNIFKKELKIE